VPLAPVVETVSTVFPVMQLKKMDIRFHVTEECVEWIAQLGYDPQFGARPLKRVIQRHVMNELSKEILAGKVSKDSDIVLDVFDGKMVFRNRTEKEAASES